MSTKIDWNRVVTAAISAGFVALAYALRADPGIYGACLFLSGGTAHHAAGAPLERMRRKAAPAPPPSD